MKLFGVGGSINLLREQLLTKFNNMTPLPDTPLESLIEYTCSMVIGCLAVATLAFKCLCGDGDGDGDGDGGEGGCKSVATNLYKVLWTICVVYLVVHFTYTHARHTNRLLFKFHHVVAIVGCMFVYFFPAFETYWIIMACMEVSSAKLHAMNVDAFKWILSEQDLVFMFIFAWVLFRCLLSPCLLILACRLAIAEPEAPNIAHVAFHAFFFSCNVYWTCRFYKRLFNETTREQIV